MALQSLSLNLLSRSVLMIAYIIGSVFTALQSSNKRNTFIPFFFFFNETQDFMMALSALTGVVPVVLFVDPA